MYYKLKKQIGCSHNITKLADVKMIFLCIVVHKIIKKKIQE